MTDDHTCRRCGRGLSDTPMSHRALPWWDSARVHAQGWVGSHVEDAVGLECLSHAETQFLLPAPRQRHDPGTGRFQRTAPSIVPHR